MKARRVEAEEKKSELRQSRGKEEAMFTMGEARD